MIWVKIITDDYELEEYSYSDFKSGGIYYAEKVSASYYDVFFDRKGGWYHTMHKRHLVELTIEEVRDMRLNQLLGE